MTDTPRFSWLRTGLTVIVICGVSLAGLMLVPPLLEPPVPYGTGTVTVAGVTTAVHVCESLEHGIELHDGDRGAVLYVGHVGPEGMYAGHEVEPARFDGTYLVEPTADGERWSDRATVDVDRTEWTVTAALEDGRTVIATYENGGWCRGADPNVLGR